MSDHQIGVIDQLMKTVVARLLWLRECAEGNDELLEQIDAAIQESSIVSHNHEVEVARMVNLVDELRGQRDKALDEVTVLGVQSEQLARVVDDLALSIEDLRERARDPERIVANRVRWQMDLSQEQAETLLKILMGDLDVYLSHYTEGDLREYIEIALKEVEEARVELEAEGGSAE